MNLLEEGLTLFYKVNDTDRIELCISLKQDNRLIKNLEFIENIENLGSSSRTCTRSLDSLTWL